MASGRADPATTREALKIDLEKIREFRSSTRNSLRHAGLGQDHQYGFPHCAFLDINLGQVNSPFL